MNWKKYLKILLTPLIIGGIIWVFYWFFAKNPAGQKLTETMLPQLSRPTAVTQTQKTMAAQKLQTLTQIPIFDYWTNKKTGDIYYIAKTGEVIKKSGAEETIASSQTINNLHSVIPSPDGTFAAVKFNYPFTPTFSIFSVASNDWKVLPPQTLSLAWSPDSTELLYLTQKSLNKLNIASQKSQKIIDLSQKDLQLHWLSSSKALLMPSPSIETLSDLWSLDLSKKSIQLVLDKESGLLINWSSDSDFGLKFSNKNRVPSLSLIDKNGNTLTRLSFVTLPSKCLIEANKIFCGVPKIIKEGTALPDDYYKKAVYFDDVLYLIDLSDGSSRPILENNTSPIDAEHLELNGHSLLFKNRLDDKLYSLELE